MSQNIIDLSKKTLSDYFLFIADKPQTWYEQIDARYPWIFDQLERLQLLLESTHGEFCPKEKKITKTKIARESLSSFVLKFQAMYKAIHPHSHLPSKYQRKQYESWTLFYHRFIDAIKDDTDILGLSYMTNIASYEDLKQALKDYEYYSTVAVLPRASYSELSALNRSLQAFFPLVKRFVSEESLLPKKRKPPSPFIRWLLKKES